MLFFFFACFFFVGRTAAQQELRNVRSIEIVCHITNILMGETTESAGKTESKTAQSKHNSTRNA
jgi:hypothetical protein